MAELEYGAIDLRVNWIAIAMPTITFIVKRYF